MFSSELSIFNSYLNKQNLRHSQQRDRIVKLCLSVEKHVSVQDLYLVVHEKYPNIGYATVSRTMKLLCECNLCRELVFKDKITRYEHQYGHEHHDHLVCLKCSSYYEVTDPDIEALQQKLAEKHNFEERYHIM